MALIPLEGLGAPSQKTSLLGGVAQILINPRPSPRLADVGDSLFEGDCWNLGRTNSPTSARRGDGLGFTRIWATPPNRLFFWDGAPSPSPSLLT